MTAASAGLHAAYLRQLGVDPDGIEGLQHYASLFAGCRRVLDIGCGFGNFVGLLASRGIDALGVDGDADNVGELRRRGRRGVCADVRTFLQAEAGAGWDGIFASNLVEHLDDRAVRELVEACSAALRAGGRLVLTTPNPAAISAHLRLFYRGLEHVRFYDGELLVYYLSRAGFVGVRAAENPCAGDFLLREERDSFLALADEFARALELPDPGPGASWLGRWRHRVEKVLVRRLFRTIRVQAFAASSACRTAAAVLDRLDRPWEIYVYGEKAG